MAAKHLKSILKIDMKFNDEFDPSQSRRNDSKSIYDTYGRIRVTRKDVCDCLDNRCVGCHFPCKWCKSTKCGPTCRKNRNDYTKKIEIDGADDIIFNRNFSKKK